MRRHYQGRAGCALGQGEADLVGDGGGPRQDTVPASTRPHAPVDGPAARTAASDLRSMRVAAGASWVLLGISLILVPGAVAETESESTSGWRLLREGATLDSLALWLMFGDATRERERTASSGSHIWRPDDDAAKVLRRYVGAGARGDELAVWNPELGRPQPGTRVQVPLPDGLPKDGAMLRRLRGPVAALPAPVPWLEGRALDLLAAGDGLRTGDSGSAELTLADSTRLVVSEDSLIFLRGPPPAAREPGAIEIVAGQTDLVRRRGERGEDPPPIELVFAGVRARSRADREGELATRARRDAAGEVQILVFRGAGVVSAEGVTVEVPAGSGTVVSPGAPPSPPERLLPAPVLIEPAAGARTSSTALRFLWSPVAGAVAYTFELCLDPGCGELVEREVRIAGTAHRVGDLEGGSYFWRVTAAAPSGLDGFPSLPSELVVAAPVAATAAATSTIAGRVYAVTRAMPLEGATVRVVELGREATSDAQGRFALDGVPPGRYALEAFVGGRRVGRLEGVPVEAGRSTEVALVSEALLVARDEIVVRPSRVALLGDAPVAPLAIDRDDMLALPHLGDDLFRALPMLPGTAANDVSAEFHVRGGRRDEVAILLDGQELYEAFHLVDYDNALSIVAPSTLESVELTTGGWQAEHGDRMAGILDMRTGTPEERRSQLGVSFLTFQGGTAGSLPEGRGSGLFQARRGSTDLVGKLFGAEDPSYWDLFAKAERRLAERYTLRAHALLTGDRLDFAETVDGESKTRRTALDGTYLWLSHQAWLGERTAVDTAVAWSRSSGRRNASEIEDEQRFEVDDHHWLEVAELRQGWDLQAGERHLLSWGAALRRFDASYDYFSFKHYDTPIALLRAEPREGELVFVDRLDGDHTSAFVKDRWRLAESLILELGLRYDRHSWLDEEHLSPRLNLASTIGEGSVLRAAWGRFLQSQRPHELQVEDAETAFSPVERSEQWLLGYERVVTGASPLAGLSFRVEAFQRRIRNPRPRFENLYEPFNTFPELEPDRVRIAPERSRAAGLELFVRGPRSQRLDWWLSYGYSSSEDRIGGRWSPRRIDQTHAFSVNLNIPLGEHWRLDLAWRYHTGWPTTPLSLAEVIPGKDGEEDPDEDPDEDPGEDPGGDPEPPPEPPEPILVPVLGPLHSERLADFHRLDLRASRELAVRRGRLTFFVDLQNVYDRRNASGFDFAVDEEARVLVTTREDWPGFFPSLGLEWEF